MNFLNILKDLIINALWDFIKFVIPLIFLSSTTILTSSILTDSIEALTQYRTLVIVSSTSFAILIFLFFYFKFNKHKPNFPQFEFDFINLKKEIILDFSSRNKMLYKKRSLLKTLRKGLYSYSDKYHWTGSGEVSIESNIKNQKFQKTLRKNIFQHYEILFSHSLKKKEVIQTELQWDLSDKSKTMVPFISATVEEPTNLLVFKVSFPPSIKVKEVTCEIASSIGKSKSLEVTEISLDDDKIAIWEIENPKLLHHYEMSWSF